MFASLELSEAISSTSNSISSISCLTEGTKRPLSAGRVHYHWEVKAERIRKGQEQGSQLQGNKGKPIPPGIIMILETLGSPDSGSMGLSGRRRKEEGSRAGYCPKESVPRCVQITPKVVGDPVTCSDVLV